MSRPAPRIADSSNQVPAGNAARQHRKSRVMALVAEGFPVPQGRLFELLQLLGDPVLNLGGVSGILRDEPRLGEQILGLLRASAQDEDRQLIDVSEAVVLLGSERLRILAIGCALAQFAGRHLSAETVRGFWHHSLLTALLSQKIACEIHAEPSDQAYFAGLLHDLGRIPLLIVAQEEERAGRPVPAEVHDHPARERDCFGVDHCEVGRWIACCGHFPAWMAAVLEHHHDPAQLAVTEDAALAAIVAAADRRCRHRGVPVSNGLPGTRTAPTDGDLLTRMRPPNLLAQDQATHSQFLKSWTEQTPFPLFGRC